MDHLCGLGGEGVEVARIRNDRDGEIDPARLPTEADFAAMRGSTDDQLRGVDVPVLVLIGDTDFILVPNAAEMADLLPHGQLAVLPATTHMGMTRSDLVAPVVETLLADA